MPISGMIHLTNIVVHLMDIMFFDFRFLIRIYSGGKKVSILMKKDLIHEKKGRLMGRKKPRLPAF